MAEISFGEWLRRRRKAAGWTQEQLAQQISCSTSALKKFEAEERRPSAPIVEQLAEIFHIPSDERKDFARFARGDWSAAPGDSVEDYPWRAARESEKPETKISIVTFLFTDIESSAKLWDSSAEKMQPALQRHNEILQEAISSNNGKTFQIVGDAFFAAFPTVGLAISAAISAQRTLHEERWNLPFPIRVRMGIHTGEAVQSSTNPLGGDYESNQTMNRAARILSAGHGGQVLLSLASTDLIRNSLPSEVGLRDMGEHQLKNLIHPERLFQLNIAGLPSEFPPLNTLTHRHNLPTLLTSFVAREQEIELILDYLSREEIRLVTLVGPPGIGKTRLGIRSAHAALPDFPDGVFFVPLAFLDDSHVIASAVMQALGYVESGNATPENQLKDGIGDKQILIVLDNCEHLIEGTAALASALLSACSQLKILATSRESFRIPGEWLYPVPAFDLPKDSAAIDPDNAALMLFAERARAVEPEFELTTDNINSIAAICARLDGLPLAIELIAARIRLMSPKALLERLSDQFILTADGMRTLPGRQKTLHHAIDWSYNLLSAEEQDLFARLSVFSGGFTLEAAESILSRTMIDTSIAGLITSLLDKSLLQRSLDERSEPRFTMMVTIQQFALNRLIQRSEETTVRNWHLAYFLALTEQADQEIHGPNQIEWIDLLEAEHDNFRAALDWCISSKQTESTLRLFNGLGVPWLMRNRFSEMRGWFDQIRTLSDVTSYPMLYARALNVMGRLNWLLSDFQEGQSLLDEAKAIWLSLRTEDERGLAEALDFLGLIAFSSKTDLQAAQALLEESLELYQKYADQRGTAFVTVHLGMVKLAQNDTFSALSLLEQSMDLFHHLGDIWGKARASQLLGELFLRQGDYEKARFYFEQNLRFDEELKFKVGMVVALRSLGNLHRYQSEYSQARQFYEKSLDISRAYGIVERWDLSLYFLGLVALHQNNYPAARQYFVDYIKAERESLNKVNAYVFVLSQAAVSAGTNQPERAARLSGAAQGISERLDYQISRFDQAEFARHIQIAREQLGEKRFEALAAEGRLMTMEQAIAYALEEDT